MVNGVAGQQRLLVLDALRLGLLLVFILLTQSCIDRAKDLLHLLQGVTAHVNHNIWAVAGQEIILNACAGKTTQASFVEFFCEPGGDGLTDSLVGRCGIRRMVFSDGQWLFFHEIISSSYIIKRQIKIYDRKWMNLCV